MKHLLIVLTIISTFLLTSCKKAKDPTNITIKIEGSCAYSVNYNLYYDAKYDPYYYSGVGNSEKIVKLYDGDRLLVKTTKNLGGTDYNPLTVTLLQGSTALRTSSSSKDGEVITLDYIY